MFEIIFLIVICLYLVQTILFSVGAGKKFKKVNVSELPTASVIVAARNEERNILKCMESLNNLEYPEGKLQIIIVNDNSDDKTEEIIKEYIKEKPRFVTLNTKRGIGNLKGKANAIANGMELATGEIILSTDADCTVSPKWAKTMASYYTDDVGVVCGYTNQFEQRMFDAMQSIDFIYLLTVAGGAMNLGKPLSCIGNNMSYRKSVYREVGGYESLGFSVTEDFNLLKAIYKLKKYKIIYPCDEYALVTSETCHDIKTLYWQKKRWCVGGLASDLAGFSVAASAFLAHVGMLLFPFFYSIPALVIFFGKLFIDFFYLKNTYRKLALKLQVKHFLLFEIYFIIYVIALPSSLFFSRKVKWKGREY